MAADVIFIGFDLILVFMYTTVRTIGTIKLEEFSTMNAYVLSNMVGSFIFKDKTEYYELSLRCQSFLYLFLYLSSVWNSVIVLYGWFRSRFIRWFRSWF